MEKEKETMASFSGLLIVLFAPLIMSVVGMTAVSIYIMNWDLWIPMVVLGGILSLPMIGIMDVVTGNLPRYIIESWKETRHHKE